MFYHIVFHTGLKPSSSRKGIQRSVLWPFRCYARLVLFTSRKVGKVAHNSALVTLRWILKARIINKMNNLPLMNVDNNSISETVEKQGTPAQLIFFRRLHTMINNEAHSGCIVWLSDGLGFAIPSKQAFANNILGRYFGPSKFASFTRRLKRWGFSRRGDSYSHSQFKRDMVFEHDYDYVTNIIRSHHPLPIIKADIPFRSKGPLKKRFKYRLPSPPPIRSNPSSGGVSSKDKSPSDIHIMPELLRVINRQKREEKNGFLLPSESKEVSTLTEEFMIARALESLELQVRKKSSPCVRYGEFSQSNAPNPYLVKPKTCPFSRAA